MSRPGDRFCYKCRREGGAVDRFYRKIPEQDKASLTEDEQDALRFLGMDNMACAVVIFAFPAGFLGFELYSFLTGGGLWVSHGIRIFLVLLLLFAVYLEILGIQLFKLRKKTFQKKINISILKTVFSIAHYRHSIRWEDAFAALMEQFAFGEKIAEETPKTSEDSGFWVCGFCGYENTYSSFGCRSCGKERIKRGR